MRRRPIPLIAAACVLSGCLLSGCTAAVGGSGHVGLPAAQSTSPGPVPSVPGSPGSGAPASVHCPTVADPASGLRFRCVTAGIAEKDDPLWPLNLTKVVEKGWALGEGAAGVAVPSGAPLEQVTDVVREEMVALQYWGPQPGVTTLSSKAAVVAGARAWVLQTSFTLNAAFRRQHGLRVRTERTWVVAIQLSGSEVALWYVTLPDDVKALWPTVPALIKSIERI